MADKPNISNFIRAFRRTWFDAMSGGFSVPFAFAAALADNKYVQLVLLTMAFGGAWFAFYQVWKTERQKICDLERCLQPTSDAWFQHAVFYGMEGRWPYEEERLISRDEAESWGAGERIEASEIFNKVKNVLKVMRQAASDRRLDVWGRRYARCVMCISGDIVGDPLFTPISFSHWANYEVRPLQLAFDPEHVYTTKRDSIGMDDGSFCSLMVSKAQVEQLWLHEISHVAR